MKCVTTLYSNTEHHGHVPLVRTVFATTLYTICGISTALGSG